MGRALSCPWLAEALAADHYKYAFLEAQGLKDCQDPECRCHRFQGKVAILTGGAPGIGRSTALQFDQEEARLAICDVNGESGNDAHGLDP